LANVAETHKTRRTQKKGKATAEVGRLREDGHGKITRGRERERDGYGQDAMERMDEQSDPAIFGLTLTPV